MIKKLIEIYIEKLILYIKRIYYREFKEGDKVLIYNKLGIFVTEGYIEEVKENNVYIVFRYYGNYNDHVNISKEYLTLLSRREN